MRSKILFVLVFFCMSAILYAPQDDAEKITVPRDQIRESRVGEALMAARSGLRDLNTSLDEGSFADEIEMKEHALKEIKKIIRSLPHSHLLNPFEVQFLMLTLFSGEFIPQEVRTAFEAKNIQGAEYLITINIQCIETLFNGAGVDMTVETLAAVLKLYREFRVSYSAMGTYKDIVAPFLIPLMDHIESNLLKCAAEPEMMAKVKEGVLMEGNRLFEYVGKDTGLFDQYFVPLVALEEKISDLDAATRFEKGVKVDFAAINLAKTYGRLVPRDKLETLEALKREGKFEALGREITKIHLAKSAEIVKGRGAKKGR